MENQENVQQPQNIELKLADLKNLCAIVDAAVRRGAFGANEVGAVGSVFDRVTAFLNSVEPAVTEQPPATPTAE